jgi:hypothetical protein
MDEGEGMNHIDIEAITQEYILASHIPKHPSYAAFVRDTLSQFKTLVIDGWKFELVPSVAIYVDSVAMFKDMEFKLLLVDSGGQNFVPNHPLARALGELEPITDESPLWPYTTWRINEVFRVVHDISGHGPTLCPFETFEGELEAYLNHKSIYSPEAVLALYGETIGQLCHYYSGRGFVKVQECKITEERIGSGR